MLHNSIFFSFSQDIFSFQSHTALEALNHTAFRTYYLSDTPLQNQPVSKQGRAEADECSEAVRSGSSSILLV